MIVPSILSTAGITHIAATLLAWGVTLQVTEAASIARRTSDQTVNAITDLEGASFDPSAVEFLKARQSTLLAGGGCVVVAFYGNNGQRKKDYDGGKDVFKTKMNGYGAWCVDSEWPAEATGYNSRASDKSAIYVILGNLDRQGTKKATTLQQAEKSFTQTVAHTSQVFCDGKDCAGKEGLMEAIRLYWGEGSDVLDPYTYAPGTEEWRRDAKDWKNGNGAEAIVPPH